MTCHQGGRRPKPRRFPLDRGFRRTAHGQSGDEASAGHPLAVARTRYIKGKHYEINMRLQRNVQRNGGLHLACRPSAGLLATGELRPIAIAASILTLLL
jgi:hypothetical protein